MEDGKAIIHEGEVCQMTEAIVQIKDRVKVVENDVGQLKTTHKDFSEFRLIFAEHIARDDEQKKVLTSGFNEIKTAVVMLSNTVSQQAKDIMRVELEAEIKNKNQDIKQLKKDQDRINNGFWAKLKSKAEDKIIEILLWSTVAGLVLYFGGQYLSAIVEKL